MEDNGTATIKSWSESDQKSTVNREDETKYNIIAKRS